MNTVKINWPNMKSSNCSPGVDWLKAAYDADIEIPTGCLGGSCGACEIDVNGQTVRACVSEIKSNKKCLLNVSLTTDPFWES